MGAFKYSKVDMMLIQTKHKNKNKTKQRTYYILMGTFWSDTGDTGMLSLRVSKLRKKDV